jgi:hypothetical protein
MPAFHLCRWIIQFFCNVCDFYLEFNKSMKAPNKAFHCLPDIKDHIHKEHNVEYDLALHMLCRHAIARGCIQSD